MTIQSIKCLFVFLLLLLVVPERTNAQNNTTAKISGILIIDDTWDSEIYLSYIPTFEDMYLMSLELE